MDTNKPKNKVALVDDHLLLRKGLADYIRTFEDYDVMLEASDGQDFIRQLRPECLPEIVLLDISMPIMDGYETALWITKNHPEIKTLALSVSDKEQSIIRMIRNGAKGYIVKDIDPQDFKTALDDLVRKGYYYSDLVTGRLIHSIHSPEASKLDSHTSLALSERELGFLRYVCSEMTYKEIADRMFLSARTIDGYREALFLKLGVKSRTRLAIYAIKTGIVNMII